MQWKRKGALGERLEQGPQLSFSSIAHKIAQIDYTGVVQLLKSAASAFLCVLFLLMALKKSLRFFGKCL